MALHHSVIEYRRELDILILDDKKRCTKCKSVKEIKYNFSKNKRSYGGYANHCTVCQSIGWRGRKGKNTIVEDIATQHELAAKQRELFILGKRLCLTCNQIKDLNRDFPHRLNKWARFKDDCSTCASEKELLIKTKRAQNGSNYRQRNHIKRWAKKSLDNHKNRGIITIATVSELMRLVDNDGCGVCYYTKDPIKIGYGASIDRKDPNGNFEISNLCVCSHGCNSTKSAMTESEFAKYLRANPEILSRIRKNNEDRLKLYYVKDIPLPELQSLVQTWRQ